MSLILDALKKLEQEKAHLQRKGVDLGTAIVTPETRRSSRPAVVILLVVAISVTAAATTFIIKQDVHGQRVSTSSPVPLAPPAPITEVVGATPATRGSSPPPPAPVEESRPVVHPRPQEAPAASLQPPPSTPQEPAPSVSYELTVSGIAWQEERKGRRAVINGSLLGEGAVVGGARIVEIFPEKVRFSEGGRHFDVHNSTPFPL